MSEATTFAPNPRTLPPGFVTMDGSMAAEATPSQDEGRLVERLRERDPVALREIYDRFGRITFGFLLKALSDRGAAEDVQQQVFLEVWRRSDRFDPARGRLLTWVMTITRSRAIDHQRRRVPEPVDPQAAGRAGDVSSIGAEGEIEALAEQWRMRGLLDRLPASESELLRLRFYGELTQSEIAAREKIPLGTVKTRMFNGLRRLREMIDEENGA
jgi:RNA polymerase sigma-70 factor (ECF subfamily)